MSGGEARRGELEPEEVEAAHGGASHGAAVRWAGIEEGKLISEADRPPRSHGSHKSSQGLPSLDPSHESSCWWSSAAGKLQSTATWRARASLASVRTRRVAMLADPPERVETLEAVRYPSTPVGASSCCCTKLLC